MALTRTAAEYTLLCDWLSAPESQNPDQSEDGFFLHPPQTMREGKKFIVFFKLFPPSQTKISKVEHPQDYDSEIMKSLLFMNLK